MSMRKSLVSYHSSLVSIDLFKAKQNLIYTQNTEKFKTNKAGQNRKHPVVYAVEHANSYGIVYSIKQSSRAFDQRPSLLTSQNPF